MYNEFLTGQQLIVQVGWHKTAEEGGAVTPLLCKSILHVYILVHTGKTGPDFVVLLLCIHSLRPTVTFSPSASSVKE